MRAFNGSLPGQAEFVAEPNDASESIKNAITFLLQVNNDNRRKIKDAIEWCERECAAALLVRDTEQVSKASPKARL